MTATMMQNIPAGLDRWLQKATRTLSRDSAAQVRCEILEHYESARAAALEELMPGRTPGESGATREQEADSRALASLGDPKAANCEYRQVMLTSAEAKILREGNWEARAFCSRPWIKALPLAFAGAVLFAANEFYLKGSIPLARALFAGGFSMTLLFAAPFLPVYTPARSRVFRYIKWALLLATIVFAFGPDSVKFSWLMYSCLWPVGWIEWTRMSIRRKLPVERWPKQLYL
jgi:hypothetical protein